MLLTLETSGRVQTGDTTSGRTLVRTWRRGEWAMADLRKGSRCDTLEAPEASCPRSHCRVWTGPPSWRARLGGRNVGHHNMLHARRALVSLTPNP